MFLSSVNQNIYITLSNQNLKQNSSRSHVTFAYHQNWIMSVTTFSYEYTSPIFPPRILKASIVDSHNLIPKLMPQVIKSIEITQRNGGAEVSSKSTLQNVKKPAYFSSTWKLLVIMCFLVSHFSSLKYQINELNE